MMPSLVQVDISSNTFLSNLRRPNAPTHSQYAIPMQHRDSSQIPFRPSLTQSTSIIRILIPIKLVQLLLLDV